ncbi:MAG: heparin lyase I family protein [Chthoniobacter sp.]|uniref:heparin lyase I family protein n=1 Tax=Chthoniobacter sp. TaxID=2510640 RepID=UPI0032AE55D8
MKIPPRFLCLLLTVASASFGQDKDAATAAPGYHLVYAAKFDTTIDPTIVQQKPTPDSLTVDAPGNLATKCLRVSMQQTDDYSKVANGSPRSELSFSRLFLFAPGKDYLVEWSTFIPVDFQFDGQQTEGITQIHHGMRTGSPPFMLALRGNTYQVELRGGPKEQIKTTKHPLDNAEADRGHWVKWRLHYSPDATGAQAITQVYKNDALVLDAVHEPNAYAGDEKAYLKLGIYKWGWKNQPSGVTSRTLYYGDVTVAVKD